MQAEFRPPRRRARVYEEYEAPLPVCRSAEAVVGFRAELINNHVLVCHPDHIQKIHNQGYFGKGVLSRARPNHDISNRWEHHDGMFLPVVSESRYEELVRWAGSLLSGQGLAKEAVSQMLQHLSQPVEMHDTRQDLRVGEKQYQEGAGEEDHSESKDGACFHSKRQRRESEGKRLPKGKRSCRREPQHKNHGTEPDPTSDQDRHPTSDQDPHPSIAKDPYPISDHDSASVSHPTSDNDYIPTSDQDTDSSSYSDSDIGIDPIVPGPGFVLVVAEGEGNEASRQVRQTPFSLTEYLQLSLEEAFFLVYSLGCLSVYLYQEPLSVIQLWRKFRSLQPDFVTSYTAYHYYRSKGWVPKGGSGAKYGVDFMLYRKGPPFYHASYSLVVERVDDTFRGSTLRPFTWRSLAALSRITANVCKELMLCYIIFPADLSEAELDSPVCLSRLKVQEVIVSRWVSSRERAEQDDT